MKNRFKTVEAKDIIRGDSFLCPNTGIWRQVDSVLSSNGTTWIVYSLGLGGYDCPDGKKSTSRPRKS